MKYLKPNTYTYTCRYSPYRRILNDENRIIIESVNQFLMNLDEYNDYYHIVEHDEIGRLDTISERYYGDKDLWWIIAYANSIESPIDDVSEGQFIIIPPVDSLYDTGSLYNQEALNHNVMSEDIEEV